MKRKKTEETPAKFWPVPGVDGEPYPPRVQEALDLVAKETLRRKRLECKHETRIFVSAASYDYGKTLRYQRACRDCHTPLNCEHPDNGLRRRSVEYNGGGSFLEYWECNCGELIARRVCEPTRQTGTDWLKTAEQERRTDRHVSRQIRRVAERAERLQPYARGALASSTEMFVLQNANGEAVLVVPADDRAPDLSWVRTMNGRKKL